MVNKMKQKRIIRKRRRDGIIQRYHTGKTIKKRSPVFLNPKTKEVREVFPVVIRMPEGIRGGPDFISFFSPGGPGGWDDIRPTSELHGDIDSNVIKNIKKKYGNRLGEYPEDIIGKLTEGQKEAFEKALIEEMKQKNFKKIKAKGPAQMLYEDRIVSPMIAPFYIDTFDVENPKRKKLLENKK